MDSEDLSPQSFQTGSLGIFAALEETGDNQSSTTQGHSGSFFNEHDASNTPSLAQQAAFGVLLQLGPRVVLAWLTILRSSKPGQFQSELLSSHQVAALIELKNCPDSLVEVGLHDAHRLGTFAFDLWSLELIGRCSQFRCSTSLSGGRFTAGNVLSGAQCLIQPNSRHHSQKFYPLWDFYFFLWILHRLQHPRELVCSNKLLP